MILVFESDGLVTQFVFDDGTDVGQAVTTIFNGLPLIGDRAVLEAQDASGRAARIIDRNKMGVEWLYSMLVKIVDGDQVIAEAPDTIAAADAPLLEHDVYDQIDQIAWWQVPPIWAISSKRFYLMLWVMAGVLGAKDRFCELRRYIRALQFVFVYGWGKEANLAYIGGVKGETKARRAIAIATTQVVYQSGWRFCGLILAATAYSLFLAWR
jgi:hypothetical protein